jgi:hypothetical protein
MKTVAFMQLAYIGRCEVQNNEEVLDPIHANPPTSICQIAYETGLSQSRRAYTAWGDVSFSVHILQGDNNLHLQLSITSTTKLYMNLTFLAMYWWSNIQKEWSKQSPQPT